MSKKKLNPLKLETPEKFENFLRVLWDEICWAYFYYDMLKVAAELCKQHEEDVKFSPYFWHFTLQAYCETTLVRLHRIYDQNNESFNLHRFLLTIKDNKEIFDPTEVRKRRKSDPHADDLIKAIGPFDPSQLDHDIEFSSEANPKVANLKRWRDRVTFHKDERELFRQKPFEQEHPLPLADIEVLLSEAYRMVNRYAQYFNTTQYSLGCKEWKDMNYVFEALSHHPYAVRSRAQSAALASLGLG
jgi:hypothetical protein